VSAAFCVVESVALSVAVFVAVYVRVSEYNNECKHVQDLDALDVFLCVAVAVSVAVYVAALL